MAAMTTPAMRALALRSAAMNHHYGVPAGQPGKQPGRGSGVTVVPPRPAARPHVSQSVSQVATQRVNQALAPQLADQQQQADRQNAAIQAFAQQLLGKLQPISGQVGADYNQAIGQTASLASGAADALRNANTNQQDQQLLAALGAPASQHADIANNLANTFGGGAAVLQVGQGQIPGSMLASNKASAQAFANTLPATAALKGEQDLASAMYQQGQDRQHIRDQAPGMILSESQNIRSNNTAKAQAAFEQYKFETARADAYRAADQKMQAADAQHRADLSYKYWAQTQQNQRTNASQAGQNSRTAASIAAANSRNAATIAAENKRNAASIAAANNRARAKSLSTASKASDYPNLTKTQVLHLRSGIAHAFNGRPAQKDPLGQKTIAKALPPVSYQEAINEAVAAGYSRAAATRMANHFYMPGERGRPGGKPDPVKSKVG